MQLRRPACQRQLPRDRKDKVMDWSKVISKNSAPIFIPWALFWNHSADSLRDQAYLRLGLSSTPECQLVQTTFRAKSVTTIPSRERGLGFRREPMSIGEGMLFVFPRDTPLSFWMQNTYIPLQILYFSQKGKEVGRHEMPVERDPRHAQKRYTSSSPGQVALEVRPHSVPLQKNPLYLCVDENS